MKQPPKDEVRQLDETDGDLQRLNKTLERLGLPLTEENRQLLMYGPDGPPEESELL